VIKNPVLKSRIFCQRGRKKTQKEQHQKYQHILILWRHIGDTTHISPFSISITCTVMGRFKVPVKSKLSMCSEFVKPQKNVLLATQPNLNDKKAGKYIK